MSFLVVELHDQVYCRVDSILVIIMLQCVLYARHTKKLQEALSHKRTHSSKSYIAIVYNRNFR